MHTFSDVYPFTRGGKSFQVLSSERSSFHFPLYAAFDFGRIQYRKIVKYVSGFDPSFASEKLETVV